MNFEDIKYEKVGVLAKIVINRPEKGNMFSKKTLLEMISALEDARTDESIRVITISGAGGKFFCIGGDKEDLDNGTFSYKWVLPIIDLYDLIVKHPKPVIAVVDGYAVGGGHVLHVVCDLTIATTRSIFRQVGPAMGSFDAGYGTWLLDSTVGTKRAKEIWMLNKKYTAQEALEMGLVNIVVEAENLEKVVNDIVETLSKRGPQALAAVKASFNAKNNGISGFSRVAHDLLLTYYLKSEEAKAMNKSFNEKTDPDVNKFYK